MKTIVTLFFVLFIGIAAQAQKASKEVKVVAVEMPIVVLATIENVPMGTENKVARLYKRKYSNVKKELSFTTKGNRPKMA